MVQENKAAAAVQDVKQKQMELSRLRRAPYIKVLPKV